MESNAPNNLTANIKLNAPHDWPDWISTLRQHERSRCIWERIDPAQPYHSDDAFKAPEPPELPKKGDELERLIRKRFDIDDEDKISVTSRALFCEILISEYGRKESLIRENARHNLTIRDWITQTVNRSILELTIRKLDKQGDVTSPLSSSLGLCNPGWRQVLSAWYKPNESASSGAAPGGKRESDIQGLGLHSYQAY